MSKNLPFSLICIHIVGLFTYFCIFGTLNILTGKIDYSSVNILTIIYVSAIIFAFILINISYSPENNSNIFLLEIKKFSNFYYLILVTTVLVIVFYFYLKMENIFAYTKLNSADNNQILKFAKVKNFIVIPLIFLLFFISTSKIIYQKNILFNLLFVIISLIFISFFGRRILGALLVISLLIAFYQFSKKNFSENIFEKMVIFSFISIFTWICFSNYYLNYRESNNSDKIAINSLFDYKKTINNFGSRPSPFYQLNQVINQNEKDLLLQSNGFLTFQSIENSIPKKIFSNKKFISEDLLISNFALDSGQLDLSSNTLSLFIVEFNNIGVAVYLMFIISIIFIYNIILNLLRSNLILFLSFYSLSAITIFQIEIVTSTYFNVIIIGFILVILNFFLNFLKLNKIFLLEIK